MSLAQPLDPRSPIFLGLTRFFGPNREEGSASIFESLNSGSYVLLKNFQSPLDCLTLSKKAEYESVKLSVTSIIDNS